MQVQNVAWKLQIENLKWKSNYLSLIVKICKQYFYTDRKYFSFYLLLKCKFITDKKIKSLEAFPILDYTGYISALHRTILGLKNIPCDSNQGSNIQNILMQKILALALNCIVYFKKIFWKCIVYQIIFLAKWSLCRITK